MAEVEVIEGKQILSSSVVFAFIAFTKQPLVVSLTEILSSKDYLRRKLESSARKVHVYIFVPKTIPRIMEELAFTT